MSSTLTPHRVVVRPAPRVIDLTRPPAAPPAAMSPEEFFAALRVGALVGVAALYAVGLVVLSLAAPFTPWMLAGAAAPAVVSGPYLGGIVAICLRQGSRC